MPITSAHNTHLKELRKLSRRRRARELAGRFVAEGEDLLAAADSAGWNALERYCAAGSGLAGTEVEPELLDAVSELGSGTRTLAVYETRWAQRPLGPLCVSLHGVSDPGNVGTILRSAAAFGAASVAIGPGSADPYGPKAVRASMGSLFRVPLGAFDAAEGRRVALVPRGGVPLPELAVEGEVVLVLGSEREGLPDDVLAACEERASIPQPGGAESLNVALAGAIALYELARRGG